MNNRQITKININGFKSIKECSLDLNMINMLIGSNGSGKTNFISLFKMLQNMIDGELQSYIAKHGGPNAFLFFGSKQPEKMSAEFYFGSNGYQFTLSPTTDDRMMFDGEWFYWERSGKMRIGSGYFESKWQEGCKNGIDDYVKPILRNQKWRVYHFHDTSDTALVKQIHGINDNIELSTDARNLAAFLYRLKNTEENSYNQIVRTIQLVAPYFEDFILRPNPLKPDSIRLEWKDKNSDIPFIASQLSDGTLRFICLATLLLQPFSLMPETILIDEPEFGLHPYAISLLASLIKKASVRKQIIVSTQSVELLNEFEAKDVIVVNHQDNQSVFSRLDSEQLQVWLDMVHEFEALLFSKPECFSYCGLNERAIRQLCSIREEFDSPEHINNNPNTAPSKRILAIHPTYTKPLDGYNIAKDIGIDLMRQECQHFNAWVERLTQL